MSLYGLEESELFWEKKHDTKLLLAWNRNTFVVAFRGTASLANALADVQVLTCCPTPPSIPLNLCAHLTGCVRPSQNLPCSELWSVLESS
jgi:hypothetical protein